MTGWGRRAGSDYRPGSTPRGAQKRKEQEQVGERGRECEKQYENEKCEEVKERNKTLEGEVKVQMELNSTCQKRCLTAHIGKTQPTVTVATNKKLCASFMQLSPVTLTVLSLSSCVATPFFKRQTSSWTRAKTGQKQLRNFRSTVCFSLLVLGLWPLSPLGFGSCVKAAVASTIWTVSSYQLTLSKTTVGQNHSSLSPGLSHNYNALLLSSLSWSYLRLNLFLFSISSTFGFNVAYLLLTENVLSYKILLLSPYWYTFGIPLKSQMSHWYFK